MNTTTPPANGPVIGVIVVTYASADVIGGCLGSLLNSKGVDLRIAIVDNRSPDESREVVREVAGRHGIALTELSGPLTDEAMPAEAPHLTLLDTGRNAGFAGGVNHGLRYLFADPQIEAFWILNPDCELRPDTAAAYARCIRHNPGFGMMGGRTLYHGESNVIQSDGGLVNRFTGFCSNLHYALEPEATALPSPEEIDYLVGANFIVSRPFVEQVGLMHEDYFLYYEEVDWALRRGRLPIVLCEDAVVLHHAGTAIGSGTSSRAPSAFSNYFNFRSRMIFMRRFHPFTLPVSYLYSMLKIVQILLKVGPEEAWGAFKGLNGLAPPAHVAERLEPDVRAMLGGRRKGRRG